VRGARLDAIVPIRTRERAFDLARHDPLAGVSAEAAAFEIAEVLDGIGDTCPECPPAD
jgi:hypothetical protein